MKTRLFSFLALSLLTLAPLADALAQCAMCAATVESNGKSEQATLAKGINMGVLWLMSVPYLAFGTIAFFWYKSAKKKAAQAKAARFARVPQPMSEA